MAQGKSYYNPTPKDGKERVRRSFVVYTETADKFSQIAKITGVLSSDLLQQVMAQTVDAWEREHGVISFSMDGTAAVDLSAAVKGAQATPRLKRGNPHPSGRKKKNTNTPR
jgi:hypothetical protein